MPNVGPDEEFARDGRSACFQVKIGLSFGAPSKGVCAEVNLLALVGDPNDRMAVLADLNLLESIWISRCAKMFPRPMTGRRSTIPT